MAREELINSAVTFLQDPSVAASPLDKRKQFLESKNLTQEEIEIALARAGESATSQSIPPPSQLNYGYPPQQRPAPSRYGYGYGPYPGSWQQHQEPPRRDWRDWFIMATVTSGVGYGLYTVAKRYVMPLIAPPTPPQIEQDKAAIDAEFARAFALIEQLAADTAALKTAEEERTARLDAALEEVEAVVAELKGANQRREEEARRMGDEVRGLRDLIPKALDGWKADGDARLKDVGAELRSLKMLVGNRVGGQGVGNRPAGRAVDGVGGGNTSGAGPSSSSYPRPTSPEKQEEPSSSSAVAPGVDAPKRDTSSSFNFGSRSSRRGIPAWQLAAANKDKDSAVSSGAEGEKDGAEGEPGMGA